MLAVIDYGAGNLRSVLHSLKYLGVENMKLVHQPEELQDADKIILPGVGAFGAGMQALHNQQLVEPIREAVEKGVPYLGICLGMQFLFESSDEMGTHEGLGIIPGHVTRFSPDIGLKIPHMGWNQLNFTKETPIFDNLPEPSYAYFVHSYYCIPQNHEDISATVWYGADFTVAIQHDNVFGVQFHPEKSQKVGLSILKNFLAI